MSPSLTRRQVVLWLVAALLGTAAGANMARAKESGSGGGGSGSGGGGSGSSGGGGDSGGGDSSGKGGGDDGGGDDGGADDGGGDNGGGNGRGRHRGRDHKKAKDAVKTGKSRPLPEILSNVSSQYPGKVIDVRLNRRSNELQYDVKVITPAGQVIRVRVDAASGTIVGVKGI